MKFGNLSISGLLTGVNISVSPKSTKFVLGLFSQRRYDSPFFKVGLPYFWATMYHTGLNFVRCIREDTPPTASAENGLVVMNIIDAIYQSARVGREVALD